MTAEQLYPPPSEPQETVTIGGRLTVVDPARRLLSAYDFWDDPREDVYDETDGEPT